MLEPTRDLRFVLNVHSVLTYLPMESGNITYQSNRANNIFHRTLRTNAAASVTALMTQIFTIVGDLWISLWNHNPLLHYMRDCISSYNQSFWNFYNRQYLLVSTHTIGERKWVSDYFSSFKHLSFSNVPNAYFNKRSYVIVLQTILYGVCYSLFSVNILVLSNAPNLKHSLSKTLPIKLLLTIITADENKLALAQN